MFKKLSLFLALFICLQMISFAQEQKPLERMIAAAKQRYAAKEYNLFTEKKNFNDAAISRAINDVVYLNLEKQVLNNIINDAAQLIVLNMPVKGNVIKITLQKVNIYSEDFAFNDAKTMAVIPFEKGLHYRGIIEGEKGSIASFNFFKDEVNGIYSIASEKGNFNIVPNMEQANNTDYLLYSDYNILDKSKAPKCQLDGEKLGNISIPQDITGGEGLAQKKVRVAYFADSILIARRGGSQPTANFLSSLFNEVGTLYFNDGIEVVLSQVAGYFTNPNFRYTSSRHLLFDFSNTVINNYNGNVVQLLTAYVQDNRPILGGLAWLNTLCKPSVEYNDGTEIFRVGPYSIANMYVTTFSPVTPVPNYSWNVECSTHEIGHNLGSPHTHSCSWPGGAIDNCYTTEGSCSPGPTPVNGGTIMSYCHLSNIGINFTKGFGTLPGNLIRGYINNATCLTTSIKDFQKSEIGIYPNPAKDVLNVDLKALNNRDLKTALIYDYTGRLIKEEQLQNSATISIKDLSPGVYLIKVISKGNYGTALFSKL